MSLFRNKRSIYDEVPKQDPGLNIQYLQQRVGDLEEELRAIKNHLGVYTQRESGWKVYPLNGISGGAQSLTNKPQNVGMASQKIPGGISQ